MPWRNSARMCCSVDLKCQRCWPKLEFLYISRQFCADVLFETCLFIYYHCLICSSEESSIFQISWQTSESSEDLFCLSLPCRLHECWDRSADSCAFLGHAGDVWIACGFPNIHNEGNGMGHRTEFCYQKRLIRTYLWLNLLSMKKTQSRFFKCLFLFCDFNLHSYCGLTKVWVSKRFEHIAAYPYIYDWTIKFRVWIVAGNDLQQLLICLWHVSTIVPGCCERSLEGIATCHIPGKRAGSLHDYRPPRPTFLHVSA